ncbi:MAG: IS110 family transposase [Pedobacter sp.]|nr:MAG: IS110 family transposase [Pedobacter sp.]
MTKSKTWRYNFFIGIDVSKSDLDVVLMVRNTFVGHYKIANEPYEIKALIKQLKEENQLTIASTLFGMERTGIYCNHLINTLEKLKANIVLENPVQIKNSLGLLRGKSDRVDAERIAKYLVIRKDDLVLFCSRRTIIDKLARLAALRGRLIATQGALKTPLSEENHFLNKSDSELNQSLCNSTLQALRNDIIELEGFIRKLWRGDERICNLMKLIMSIPGLGEVTSLQIVIITNEFININDPRKFACYAGVAPFEHKSGSSVRSKTQVSHMADKKLKSLLHTCALSASIHNPEIRAYYLRRVEKDGKPKMSVLNAIRFKLITRIFTCVKQNRVFTEEYNSHHIASTEAK